MLLFPGALGDLVLALPTLRRVRALDADVRAVLAVARHLVPIARAAALADRVEAVDGTELATTLGGGPAPPWWGHAARLHAWLGQGDPAVRAALARHAGEATFLRVVRGDGPIHAADAYARGVDWRPTWPELVAGAALARPPGDLAAAEGTDRVLVVHRGAGSVAKRWPPEAFAVVAAAWRARGGTVIDLRGPADAALPPLEQARVVAPSVAELPDVIASATAFVGNDSGPAHVAAAVGRPGVVVFTATRPARWRPLSTRIVALDAGDDSAPEAVVDALDGAIAHA